MNTECYRQHTKMVDKGDRTALFTTPPRVKTNSPWQVFMELKGSLPHSQKPKSRPYLESIQSFYHHTPSQPKINFNIVIQTRPWSPKTYLSFRTSDLHFVCISYFPTCITFLYCVLSVLITWSDKLQGTSLPSFLGWKRSLALYSQNTLNLQFTHMIRDKFVCLYSILCGLTNRTYLLENKSFIILESHLCKMSSQSNQRRIKQFLLFFKISQSFSFSNATAKDTCFHYFQISEFSTQ
jgi:hypothetical protein